MHEHHCGSGVHALKTVPNMLIKFGRHLHTFVDRIILCYDSLFLSFKK